MLTILHILHILDSTHTHTHTYFSQAVMVSGTQESLASTDESAAILEQMLADYAEQRAELQRNLGGTSRRRSGGRCTRRVSKSWPRRVPRIRWPCSSSSSRRRRPCGRSSFGPSSRRNSQNHPAYPPSIHTQHTQRHTQTHIHTIVQHIHPARLSSAYINRIHPAHTSSTSIQHPHPEDTPSITYLAHTYTYTHLCVHMYVCTYIYTHKFA